MKALLRHGALVGCATHKRKRSFKVSSTAPKTKCSVCWACWLADRLETSIYETDVPDLMRFAKSVENKRIQYEETAKDE